MNFVFLLFLYLKIKINLNYFKTAKLIFIIIIKIDYE